MAVLTREKSPEQPAEVEDPAERPELEPGVLGRKKKPVDPPVDPAEPAPPAPKPPVLKFPTGPIKTKSPLPGEWWKGVTWDQVSRWESLWSKTAAEFGLDPYLLPSMSLVESNSRHWEDDDIANGIITGGGGALGIMQVVYSLWGNILPGADCRTPEGNIRIAGKLMAEWIKNQGGWEQAIRNKYHPSHDQRVEQYITAVRGLMAEAKGVALPPEPTPPPEPPKAPVPPTTKHPYDVMLGGARWAVNYGFGVDRGINSYRYGVGHGTGLVRSTQHTGDDILVPENTPIFAPLPGKITCVGTQGHSTWGQTCGSFTDDRGGVGNITLLCDTGHKITFGHCRTATVRPGQMVKAGDKIGTSGYADAAHIHLDVSIYAPELVNRAIQLNGGDYFLINPAPALQKAMGGTVTDETITFGNVKHPPYEKKIVPKPWVGAGYDVVPPRKIVGDCDHQWWGYGDKDSLYRLFGTGGERQGDALTDYSCTFEGELVMLNEPLGTRSPHANWFDQAKVPYTQFPFNPNVGCVTHLQHWESGGQQCPFRSPTASY